MFSPFRFWGHESWEGFLPTEPPLTRMRGWFSEIGYELCCSFGNPPAGSRIVSAGRNLFGETDYRVTLLRHPVQQELTFNRLEDALAATMAWAKMGDHADLPLVARQIRDLLIEQETEEAAE